MSSEMRRSEMRRLVVEVFGHTMMMRGEIALGRRLTDLVNEADPYLEMSEVSTFPYTADTVVGLERHHRGIVNKTSIVIMSELESEGHPPAPPSWDPELRVPKKPHSIISYTDHFAINASLHLTEGANMAHFLSTSPEQFIPFTNATVQPAESGIKLDSFLRPFLLINRAHISYLGEDADHPASAPMSESDTIG